MTSDGVVRLELGPITGIRKEADPRFGTFPHEHFERWGIRIGQGPDEVWVNVPRETGEALWKLAAEKLGADAFLIIEARPAKRDERGSADG